jgi:hypothetical protein
MCAHGGQAMPTAMNPQVMVSGMPTVTLAAPYTVAGCAMPPPPAGNGPCVTAQFMMGSVRVTSNGMPLLLFDSQALCVPTGTPTITAASQTRVIAT